MKKLQALLFALACAIAAPAYAAQNVPSDDAAPPAALSNPALALPAFKKMVESGKPSERKTSLS